MKPLLKLSILALLFFSQCTPPTQVIVKNGKSDYTIVLPNQEDTLLLFAATELQSYIEKTTKVNLPIETAKARPEGKVIRLGWPDSGESLHSATIQISSHDEAIDLTGGSSLSSLYAVYTFLENYAGVRFYSPWVEKIPTVSTLEIPVHLQYTYTPDITTRTVHSRMFYDHPTFAHKLKVTPEAFPGYVPDARVHTFNTFVPEKKYFKTHPEYFALRNGKRLPSQLCLTNPDVYDLVVQEVEGLLKQYPKANVISVSQNDNTQHCQCPECSAVDESEESPSGSMIQFVNRVARAFPHKQISTLAYQYTRKAPANILPEKNVLITLCSIECDRSGPIREKSADFTHDLEAWGKLTDKIRIWDYTTQFTNFLAPFPNLETLQPNIQLFRDNHAKWVFEQHSNNPSELFELRSYLTAKLLWEPDASADSLTDDFLNGYYQEAAPLVKNYITTIHKELKKEPDFFLFLYGDPSQAFDSYLRPELLLKYDDWYNQAEKAVETKPEVMARVKTARLSIDFALLEAARKQPLPEISLVQKNKEGAYEKNKSTLDRLNTFATTCAANNITLLNEMGYRIEDYVTQYKATMERAQNNNLALNKPVDLLTKPKKYANENPLALTDGAYGGLNFYSNWLGFEGNNLEAIIDLQQEQLICEISSAFLQVTNHLVFFPLEVTYLTSTDGSHFNLFGKIKNQFPLTSDSKVNDIQNFVSTHSPIEARYIKIVGNNQTTPPIWHHGAGLPAWLFVDEVMIK